MSVLSDIGKFFATIFNGIFHAAKSAYLKLQGWLKVVIDESSMIIAVIGKFSDAEPAVVWTAITTLIPSLTKEKLEADLLEVTKIIGIAIPFETTTFEGLLPFFQLFLKNVSSGNSWISRVLALVNALITVKLSTAVTTTPEAAHVTVDSLTSVVKVAYDDNVKGLVNNFQLLA